MKPYYYDDHVTLYHGVTLGGTSLVRGAKRHPTLERGVIVGANACVLGGFVVLAGVLLEIAQPGIAQRHAADPLVRAGAATRQGDMLHNA